MGYYLTAFKTTACFRHKNRTNILKAIKQIATKYVGFEWQSSILKAEDLDDVIKEFGIKWYSWWEDDEDDERYIPIIYDVYASCAFPEICRAIAPYMENGVIKGFSDYGRWKVKFKNGVATIKTKHWGYENWINISLYEEVVL